MVTSHFRVMAVLILAAGCGGLLAWLRLASDGDNKPPRAPEVRSPAAPTESRGGTPQSAAVSPPKKSPWTVTVEVRDFSTRATIPDVHLECSYAGGAKVTATTGSLGTARVILPGFEGSSYLDVRASRDGLVPLVISWSRGPQSPVPSDQVSFLMEQAVVVGGRVLDQDQRPVAGAVVVINVQKRYSDSGQRADLFFASTKANADGRWCFSNIPADPDGIEVGAYHHLCLTGNPFFSLGPMKPLSAFRDRSAVLFLRRGTPIEGTVLGPDGRPVADALVYYGEEAIKAVDGIPPIRADSDGRFSLGMTPGTVTLVTARCDGFGPALQTVRAGTALERVTLRLQPAHVLTGRVVDCAGRSVAGAALSVKSWRGSRSLVQPLFADADGRFRWGEAPGDEVRVQVDADGFVGKRDVPLVAGAENRIVMASPTSGKGEIVDAESGQPIPDFTLVCGEVRTAGARAVWRRGEGLDRGFHKAPGSFEGTFRRTVEQLIIRVEAAGYRPADSGLFAQDGSLHEFTFRLTRVDPVRGTVLHADGSPVTEGFVYLVPAGDELRLTNGDVPKNQRDRTIFSKISPDGRFSLPPDRENYQLVAIADAGFAIVRQRDVPREKTLRLQPWALVRGIVMIGTKPCAETLLFVEREPPDPAPSEGDPILEVGDSSFTTDASGRFRLSRVIPGHYLLVRGVPNGVNRVSPITMATFDVDAGRSYDLTLGGRGRPIIGRLLIPTDVPWLVKEATIESKTVAGKPQRSGVEVTADGRFRADNVEPGEHQLRVIIHEPPPFDICGWGRLVGEFRRDFNVSPIEGGVSDDPLDLGDVPPPPGRARPLGSAAPNGISP